MRTTTCEKSVTAKVVVFRNDQQLSFKIDDIELTKMFGDVISIDDNTLAEKSLFLENFAVTYDTDTLLVSEINIYIRCIYALDLWRCNIYQRNQLCQVLSFVRKLISLLPGLYLLFRNSANITIQEFFAAVVDCKQWRPFNKCYFIQRTHVNPMRLTRKLTKTVLKFQIIA